MNFRIIAPTYFFMPDPFLIDLWVLRNSVYRFSSTECENKLESFFISRCPKSMIIGEQVADSSELSIPRIEILVP